MDRITYWVHGGKVVCDNWMADDAEPYKVNDDTWVVNGRMWRALVEAPDFMAIVG